MNYNCEGCLTSPVVGKIIVPEEEELLPANGSREPKDNLYCVVCGYAVPVAVARKVL